MTNATLANSPSDRPVEGPATSPASSSHASPAQDSRDALAASPASAVEHRRASWSTLRHSFINSHKDSGVYISQSMLDAGLDALASFNLSHHYPGFDQAAVVRIFCAMRLAQIAQVAEFEVETSRYSHL